MDRFSKVRALVYFLYQATMTFENLYKVPCVCVCEMRVKRVYEQIIPQINLSSPNRQRKWKECVHRPVSVR